MARVGLMAVVVTWGLASGTVAEAGVRGGTFAGTVNVSNNGQLLYTGTMQTTFEPGGSYVLVQNFGTEETFLGTFTEFDLVIVSVWHGTVTDGSPDGKGEQYGIGLFGFATTFLGLQPDIDPGLRATGILFRSATPTSLPFASGTGIAGQK